MVLSDSTSGDKEMILSIIVGVVLTAAIVGLLTHKWVGVPLLTKVQGGGSVEGMVDSIRTLPGGVIEIGLKQGGTIEPSLQEGPMVMTGCSVTSFVHSRSGDQYIPKRGVLVRAETTNRFYHFRGRSLNWVRSWEIIDFISSGVTVRIV